MFALRSLKKPAGTFARQARVQQLARLGSTRMFSKQVPIRASDTFSTGDNSYYIQKMYDDWQKDPSSVHSSWDAYFSGIKNGVNPANAFATAPSGTSGSSGALGGIGTDGADMFDASSLDDHMKLQLLVRAFQVRGHIIADVDPLHLSHGIVHENVGVAPELKPEYYGWSESDMDKEYNLGPGILPQFRAAGIEKLKLRDIIASLKKIYSSTIGFQYAHIAERDECDWLRERIEKPELYSYSADEKKKIFGNLAKSALFEQYIASKYPNAKRFGLEGGESTVVALQSFIDQSVQDGVRNVNIAMAHRGRLNVLANVVHKPVEAILNEFSPPSLAENPEIEPMADVKYHLGANWTQELPNGDKLKIVMEANPSHLEAANGSVLGRTRGIQDLNRDNTDEAVAILVHGDAAFAGQGVVYETALLHDLEDFKTGGSLHVIINNQIGFTTDPTFGRSTPYASDIGKAIGAPIFHVNSDDPEAVNYVANLAANYRRQFKKDVIIDLICYRRHGHNEIDQPSFTQPMMYAAIDKTPPSIDLYEQRLVKEGKVPEADLKSERQKVWDAMDDSFKLSKEYKPHPKEWLSSRWEDFPSPDELATTNFDPQPTGVSEDALTTVGKAVSSAPDGFNIHRNLKRILTARAKAVDAKDGIDYPTAELMAYGTLALEGNTVRLSGQDVERGTFSQRHSVYHDQKDGSLYFPMKNLSESQAPVHIVNSPLSEYGVLGFELGYSLVSPNSLTVWEAQFGDFNNGAQILIDQFIVSGEKKWTQRTGLVMNLPHGFDGQGPEHSSGRIERFLQLTEDNPYVYPDQAQMERQHQDCNIQVLMPSTPATIFHALRRQVHRSFRKPLIVFMSKSLLRHPKAKASFAELSGDSILQRYIPEPEPEGFAAPDDVKRHILCAGQVYYTLLAEREKRGITDVAISRIEEISPVPYEEITQHLDKYKNADLYWVQEEPLNSGCWSYLKPRLDNALKHTQNHQGKAFNYAGREPTSSVATGSGEKHQQEIQQFLDDAFNLERQWP